MPTTYIICNKREQVPPMLVWENQEYYVTYEPTKAEKVSEKDEKAEVQVEITSADLAVAILNDWYPNKKRTCFLIKR